MGMTTMPGTADIPACCCCVVLSYIDCAQGLLEAISTAKN